MKNAVLVFLFFLLTPLMVNAQLEDIGSDPSGPSPEVPIVGIVQDGNSLNCDDGKITITSVNGGVEPYEYSWSNGQSTQNLSELGEGEYTLTVTDALCGTASKTFSITCKSFEIQLDEISECLDGLGSINIIINQSSDNTYTFEWYNIIEEGNWPIVSNEQNLTGVEAGKYCVVVTSPLGESDSECFDLYCCEETFEIVSQELDCDNKGEVEISIIDGFSIEDVEFPIELQVTDLVTSEKIVIEINDLPIFVQDLALSVYNIELVLTELCSNNVFVDLRVEEPLDVLAEIIPVDCETGDLAQVTFQAVGGTPPYTYSWGYLAGIQGEGQTLETNNDLVTAFVSDSKGCIVEKIFTTINFWAPTELIDAIEVSTTPSCPNQSNGSITLNVLTNLQDMGYSSFVTIGQVNSNFNESISVHSIGEFTKNELPSGDYFLKFIQLDFICHHIIKFSIPESSDVPSIQLELLPGCDGNLGSAEIINYDSDVNILWSNGETGQKITGLIPGNYTVTVTSNEIVEGCEGWTITEYFVIDSALEIDADIVPICNGQNGTILMTPPDPFQEFFYEWDSGVQGAFPDLFPNNSYINDLETGTYCVTATNSNGCSFEECYEVGESDLLIPQTNIAPSCLDGNTGSIEFFYGSEYWSNININGQTVQNNIIKDLQAGSHCFTYENHCESAQICYEVPQYSLEVEYEIVGTCDYDKYIDIAVSGGVEPYSYYWSDGSIGSTFNNMDFHNPLVEVIISDYKGCTKIVEIDILEYLDFSYEVTEQPCLGFNSATIQFSAGELGLVQDFSGELYLNEEFVGNISNSQTSLNVSNISPEVENQLSFSIGECLYSYGILLQPLELESEFSHYEEEREICVFDIECNNEVVAEDGFEEQPFFDSFGASSNMFGKCELPVFCNDIQVDVKKYDLKKVSLLRYNLLRQAAQASQFNVPSIELDVNEDNLCTRVVYCPADFQIVFVQDVFGQFQPSESGLTPGTSNCFKVACEWPTSDEHFCLDDEGFFPGELDPEIEICVPREMSLYYLYENLDELMLAFPEHADSELILFLQTLTENDKPELICPGISFCANNFSILDNSEFLERECENDQASYIIDYLPSQTQWQNEYCISNLDGSGKDCCYLAYDQEGNEWAYCDYSDERDEHRWYVGDFSREFILTGIRSNTDTSEEKFTIKDDKESCMQLQDFNYLTADGCIQPKAVYKCEGRYYYEDFSRIRTEFELMELETTIFYLLNWDLNRTIAINEKEIDKKYLIGVEKDNLINTRELMSSRSLNVEYVNNFDNNITVIGQFEGELRIGSTVFANSDVLANFILEVDNRGEYVRHEVLTGVELINTKRYYTSASDNIFFKTKGTSFNHNDITVNCSSDEIYMFSMDSNTNQYIPKKRFRVESTLEILDLYTDISKKEYYSIKGKGRVWVDNQVIDMTSVSSIVQLEMTSTTLESSKMIELQGVNNVLSFIDYQGSIYYVASITDVVRINGLTINGSNNRVGHYVFLNYDSRLGSYSYSFTENSKITSIRQIMTSCDQVFFGGTYESTTGINSIGKIDYISFIEEGEKDFISFNMINDFAPLQLNENEEIQSRSNNKLESRFAIEPNPFADQVTLRLLEQDYGNISVEIISSDGRLLKELELDGDSKFMRLDLSQFNIGVMYVRIKEGNKEVVVKKIIKIK